MIKRFRIVAGPNGSGKSTLVRNLEAGYSVNFYSFINADDIYAHVLKTGAYSPKFPVSKQELEEYAALSTYPDDVKDVFRGKMVDVDCDCVRFDHSAVNSYTMALFANFMQDRLLLRGESFSQETVFSHESKIGVLKRASEMGYRTYLYFVATENPQINLSRVANRHAQGGHDVPPDKVLSRYYRSIANLKKAIPYLSRGYVFDNSGEEMSFVGEYSKEDGWSLESADGRLPSWIPKDLFD